MEKKPSVEKDSFDKKISANRLNRVDADFVLQHVDEMTHHKSPLYLLKPTGEGSLVEELTLQDFLAMPDELRRRLTFAMDGPLPSQSQIKPSEDSFFIRWNALMEMSSKERVDELAKRRADFVGKIRTETDPKVQTSFVADIVETTFLINRACLNLNKQGLNSDDAVLVAETIAITNAVIEIIQKSPLVVALFQSLQRQPPSQTFSHIIRVFALMTGFLLYYSRQHQAGLVSRIRIIFSVAYSSSYRKILPALEDNWFKSDNLVRLPPVELEQIRIYALGALLHDIGKVIELDYFDSPQGPNKEKIQLHPVMGSGLFMRTYGNTYEDAVYIIGDHHNYLFHEDGYGLTRWERKRGKRAVSSPQCCVGDTLDLFTSGRSLSYFPVEVCTIVDVYDALTDPLRSYKEVMSPGNAVTFMEENFMQTLKIDPILFDLFVDYLKTIDLDISPELGFSRKYEEKRKGFHG